MRQAAPNYPSLTTNMHITCNKQMPSLLNWRRLVYVWILALILPATVLSLPTNDSDAATVVSGSLPNSRLRDATNNNSDAAYKLLHGWDTQLWGKAPEEADPATVLLYKFSNSKNYLTSEEFSRLMQCSFSQTACPEMGTSVHDGLSSMAAVSSPYYLLADCSNNQDLTRLECDAFSRCLSVDELRRLPGQPGREATVNASVNVAELRRLLPLLVAQAQLRDCRGSGDSEKDFFEESVDHTPLTGGRSNENKKPTSAEVWGYGLLFVTIISLSSLVGVSVLPLMARSLYQRLLSVLIGLAAGSLVASALFHLLPQALHLSDYYGNHDYLWSCLYTILGLWCFLAIERLIKIAITVHANRRAEKPQKPAHNHTHAAVEYEQGKPVIRTVAWMIIFGDGFHNFLDGVSIGAAFSQSKLTGISVSLAVLCEELPHELGDFAVLLNAGMSMRVALLYNFLSALTCFAGLALGILLGEFTEDASYIFALAAGMFLYISCVDMLPELNEEASTACETHGPGRALVLLLLQSIGIVLGVVFLFTLAIFQDEIAFD